MLGCQMNSQVHSQVQASCQKSHFKGSKRQNANEWRAINLAFTGKSENRCWLTLTLVHEILPVRTELQVYINGQNTLDDKLQRQVSATGPFIYNNCFLNKSLRQNVVTAISCTNSGRFEFVRLIVATNFCRCHTRRFVSATCCLVRLGFKYLTFVVG